MVAVSPAQDGSQVILDELHYTVKSLQKSRLITTRKIIIYSPKGLEHAEIVISESRFKRVRSIKARVLDQNGKQIRKVRKSEIREIDASLPTDLYTGLKYYVFDLAQATFPYIIEYRVSVDINSLFFWPNWYPQWDIPVQTSRYRLSCPEELGFKTHAIGAIPEPVLSDKGKNLTWQLHNVPPVLEEYRMAPEHVIQYALFFASDSFVLDGIPGSFRKWQHLGNWYRQLAQDLYALDPASLTDLPRLDAASTRESIQQLYTFLQDHTRYVAIALGTHGWKPSPAQLVYENRYGDCKDLSTLFIALLAQHGIIGYPALLKTRNAGLVLDEFPSNQFNHVITYIPLPSETLWVDCTSSSATAFDLPSMDEGCNALVIRDDQTGLLSTPLSRPDDNQLLFSAEATILTEGTAQLEGTMTATGNIAQDMRNSLRAQDPAGQRNLLIQWLSDFSPSLSLTRMNIPHLNSNIYPLEIRFTCSAENYADVSRMRLFLNPSFYHRVTFEGETPDQRHTALFRPYALTLLDSISYTIPDGLTPEAIPAAAQYQYPFAQYDYRMKLSGNTVKFTRKYQIQERRIGLDQYADYHRFITQVEQKDRERLVFVR
ncbi:MAG: DUF3857 domain-containing protein [Fidelibacterota bacterium]|nr:MAG: DUF3857 domain-containing protein [Candidatus Neomarinimicrobiota bacterium]